MNLQVIKEFRALLFPWSVAMTTAILMPLANFLVTVRVAEGGAFVSFVLRLVVFVFYSSLLAIAASPFGTEFHYRTLPLLVSQPIPRSLIWRHKLIAASTGIAIALLPVVFASLLMHSETPAPTVSDVAVTTSITSTPEPTPPAGLSPEQEVYQRRYGINRPVIHSPPAIPLTPDVISASEILLTACALLLPTLCSVTFWTLLARSTLGGMVFTAFSQLLVFGILTFISERFGLANSRLGIRDISAQTPIFALAGIIYGGIFFLLSWRKFSRVDVSQLLPDTLAGSKSLTSQGLRLEWLRCRPASGFLNLVRKEIQLQKPLFIIAAILCVLWVLAYIFLLLQPSRKNFAEIVFALTIGFYIPLMSFLAGSVSLGEEKNLGIVGWHLTFPVSIWRQWAVKLAVGFAVWLLLGLLLPFSFTRVGLVLGGSRIFNELELESWFVISLFMTAVFTLSFWAMTLFNNTVRAVIGSLVAVVALCSAATLAYWLLVEFVFPQPMVRTLLDYDSHWRDAVGWVLLGASTVLLAFVQSLLQFRRLQTSSKTVVKYSCALMVFVFVATVCYFLILPFTQFTPAIYLLLFMLLLIVIRRTVASVAARADS